MRQLILSIVCGLMLSPAVIAAPAAPAKTPSAEEIKKAQEALQKQAEKDLCPAPINEDEESICFVRKLVLEGEWGALRLAQQYAADSLIVYQKQKGKWVKVLAQMAPDWEEAQAIGTKMPQALYLKLTRQLFAEQASEEF